jgi:2-iminoacetate synthase
MPLAKSGQIGNCCLPNALLTFEEYLKDYADEELREMGQKMIDNEIQNVPSEKQRARAVDFLKRIRDGERDLRF